VRLLRLVTGAEPYLGEPRRRGAQRRGGERARYGGDERHSAHEEQRAAGAERRRARIMELNHQRPENR
jgi:hypothetical protein